MTRPRLRRVPKIFGVALASLIVSFAVFYGAVVAYDAYEERHQVEAAVFELWVGEILRLHDREWRYVAAVATPGAESVLKWILWWGLDPNGPIRDCTPLTVALDYPEIYTTPEKIAAILDAGADPNRRDGAGRLPIVLAGEQSWPALFTLLLDHGADPNARDGEGLGVLDNLCVSWCRDTPGSIALLLDRGLDPCTMVRRWAGTRERSGVPLSDWLAAEKLPDLARRAEAACAAKAAGEGAP